MNIFKRNILLITLVIYGIYNSGCTRLDVKPLSVYTPANFPTTSAQFIAATGPIYTEFRGAPGREFWLSQELSSDEAVLPAFNGNWYDGAEYMQLNQHTYDGDNGVVTTVYNWGFGTISACNEVLSLFDASPASAAKTQTVAEIKTMRAMAYFFMMDDFGNVPLITAFGQTTNLGTQSRAKVFAFIESELLAQIPNLSSTVDITTYGRPTKYAAYAILAKMYLNAEYYTGTARYQDAVTMCDNIIQGGKYALDANFLAMFKPNNGPQIRDFIFAIPYDGNLAQGMYYARWPLHPALQTKYSMPYAPSGPMLTYYSFYQTFNDPNDQRNGQWLFGKQYDYHGNPIIINTTNIGLDASYSGPNPSAPVSHQLEFTANIVWRNDATFDVGDDELAIEEGARNNKFYPDSTSSSRNQGNDVPLFRYADVLLEKAEAILRGATTTNGDSPLSLVNQVRSRAGAAAFTSVALTDILDERGRELSFESWRRNDLIRFGQFEKPWGIKTDVNPDHRIFPIPNSQIQLNSQLIQNPGY